MFAAAAGFWGGHPLTVYLACESNHKLVDTSPHFLYTPPMIRHQHIEYNPPTSRLHNLLFGRRVVDADLYDRKLTLDDGTVLTLGGNEGCGGCPNGHYDLTVLNKVDNAISNVREVITSNDKHGEDLSYQIFVIFEDQTHELLAQFDGSDGNGYYGSGYWISVLPPQPQPS